jgi:hypothetical protein
MVKALKKINNVLRVLCAGLVVIYGIVKIFDIVPKAYDKNEHIDKEDSTSEFDEIW